MYLIMERRDIFVFINSQVLTIFITFFSVQFIFNFKLENVLIQALELLNLMFGSKPKSNFDRSHPKLLISGLKCFSCMDN
jgi:hypothetical protein